MLWVVNMAESRVVAMSKLHGGEKLSISGPNLPHGLSDLKNEKNYGSNSV